MQNKSEDPVQSPNPYSPPSTQEPSRILYVGRGWAATIAMAAGIITALIIALVSCVATCLGVGVRTFGTEGIWPVMAAFLAMGLGLIAGFAAFVVVVRITSRLIERCFKE